MVLETHMKLCMRELDFFFPPKFEKWTKNGPKTVVLNLLKNLVFNFLLNCYLMKIYVICCVSAQIPYLGKLLSFRYGPECSKPIRLQDFLINHISRINQ